jgi:hypothetical protein
MQLTLKEQLKALANHPDEAVIDLINTIESLQDNLYMLKDDIKEEINNSQLESFYDDFMGFDLPLLPITMIKM